MATAGWGDLPLGLLLLIAKRLLIDDVVRLRAVCRWWAYSIGKEASGGQPPQSYCCPTPWMLLPNTAGEATDACTFLDIAEGRRRTIVLPQITGRRIFGSSPNGWLVTVDPLLNPRVLNPFTREELPLPSFTTIPKKAVLIYSLNRRSIAGFYSEDGGDATWPLHVFRDLFLSKIILTSDPTQGGIAAAFSTMDTFSRFVAFARVGDNAWALGPTLKGSFVEDVIHHNGKFYAISSSGAVFVIAYMRHSSSWEVVSMVAPRIDRDEELYLRRKYIVFSSCGDLLQINRKLRYRTKGENLFQCYSKGFEIFRFDPNCYRRHEDQHGGKSDPRITGNACSSCWVRVKDLGDESIFLGSNHSFSFLASDEFGVKKNRVYFTDCLHFFEDRKTTVCDVGVLHLESNILEPFFPSDCQVNWPPPIFFVPNPRFWD